MESIAAAMQGFNNKLFPVDMEPCPKCGEVKYQPMPELGADCFVPRLCRCAREALEKYSQEEKDMEYRRDVEIVRDRSLPDKRARESRFENATETIPLKTAKSYAENWTRDGRGLMLFGPVRSGKTFLADCIANYLIDNRRTVMRVKATEIGDKLNDEYLDEVRKKDLLIIDDIGAGRETPYATEKLFQVVDARYESGLPMVVTTNYNEGEMRRPPVQKELQDMFVRIFSRLLEVCDLLRVVDPTWQSRQP